MANSISEDIKSVIKPTYSGFPRKISLAAMQEGFAPVSGNMAKTISEAFTSVKADLN